jgi:hypothetical protein
MPARTSSKTSAAHEFLASLGIKRAPAVVKVALSFRAPKQGNYQPPDYQLVIDSTQASWCTYRNYNIAPRAITPEAVMVPIEMTTFVLLEVSRGIDRAKVKAWAKSLITHAQS